MSDSVPAHKAISEIKKYSEGPYTWNIFLTTP